MLYFGGEVADMLPAQKGGANSQKEPIQYNLTAELVGAGVNSSAPSFRDLSSTGPVFNPV